MKSPAVGGNDKKVNKSLQDRLRRDRISRSVEQLRDLILGPSGAHAKIGKEDILKLTVQYIRNVRQKELMEIAFEKQKLKKKENSRNTETKIVRNESTRHVRKNAFWTEERIQTIKSNGASAENGSDETKAYCDENVSSVKTSPSQRDEGIFQSVVLRNPPRMMRPNNIQMRAPFRVIDCNSKQASCKQTIWRPW